MVRNNKTTIVRDAKENTIVHELKIITDWKTTYPDEETCLSIDRAVGKVR